MHGTPRPEKVILGHRVRKVRNNRVLKEKGLIKHKAQGHIEHELREDETRETQEQVGHVGARDT